MELRPKEGGGGFKMRGVGKESREMEKRETVKRRKPI
jgi:hypothetical protein